MEQHISQEEVRPIIISDMVKKRNSIVPFIGEDTYSFAIPLLLLWLSYKTLKWIRSAFLDEPSGRSTFGRLQGKKAEREEGSKVMRIYPLLTNISSLLHEASLVVSRTYVHEATNIGAIMRPINFSLFQCWFSFFQSEDKI